MALPVDPPLARACAFDRWAVRSVALPVDPPLARACALDRRAVRSVAPAVDPPLARACAFDRRAVRSVERALLVVLLELHYLTLVNDQNGRPVVSVQFAVLVPAAKHRVRLNCDESWSVVAMELAVLVPVLRLAPRDGRLVAVAVERAADRPQFQATR